jgi:hypothetical protein
MRYLSSVFKIGCSLCLLSFACSRGGGSEDCGPEIPSPDLTITQINGQPAPVSLDLPIQRASGASVDVQIDFSIRRKLNFCGYGYMGPLTFSLQPVSQITAWSFNPVTIPANTDFNASIYSRLNLSISSSAPDGPIPLDVVAQENTIGIPKYRLILSTSTN